MNDRTGNDIAQYLAGLGTVPIEKIPEVGSKKGQVLVMGAITENGSAISSNGKLRIWVLRLVLPADQIVSPFFAFLAKTRPKPPFGIP